MEQHDAKVLWDKYKAGEASKEEEQLILNWFHSLNKDELFDLNETELEEVHTAMLQNVSENISVSTIRRRLWPSMAVAASRSKFGTSLIAAAAVAAVVFGVWFYNTSYMNGRHPDAGQDLALVHQDIAPGKNGATITLANGKVIQLSDAKTGVVIGEELKYNDGSEVASSRSASRNDDRFNPSRDDVMQMTASTARGQTYQFTLPDGTKVWLNADSKIEFLSNFVNSKTRNVKLTGEAYFEVVHNAKQPFRVESEGSDGNDQIVEDIGTEFNINAYTDENSTRTTLVEGSARILSSRANAKDLNITLTPNQQATNTVNGIKVKTVDAMANIAWKNGKFAYNNTTMEEVMRQVARWYNIEVSYQSAGLKTQLLSGSVNRYEKLSGILAALGYTSGLHFNIEERKVYVTK